MNRAQAMRYVMLGFAAAVVLITYHDIKDVKRVPTPAEFLGAATVYGIAGVIAELAPGVGGILAIGWTIGLLFGFIPPSTPWQGRATQAEVSAQKSGPAKKGEALNPLGG